MGIFSSFSSVRPKKKAVALKEAAVSGVQGSHWPRQSLAGAAAMAFSTVKRRIRGRLAAAISASESAMGSFGGHPRRGISILDWPEQIQTSPMRTSSNFLVPVGLVTVTVKGPPAAGVFR